MSSGSRSSRSATGVTNVKPGDRCSVEPYINDPDSYSSRKGKPNCCEKLQVLGVHRDGGMRTEFLLPARKLHVSTKLAFDQLALVETLAIGCHAVNRADIQPGDSCLVIGAGPIGLATLEFVKLTGAKMIVARHERAAARLLQASRWASSIRSSSPRAWRRTSAT